MSCSGRCSGLAVAALRRAGGAARHAAADCSCCAVSSRSPAVAADRLPGWARCRRRGAAIVVGLVLLMVAARSARPDHGPARPDRAVGNILSYLRIAAVGLASAHLARVANELGELGPIWIGIFVAAFFHALNLALASFSPMIQALRLHYVEFFGTFYVGGGRAFGPFGDGPAAETLNHQLKEADMETGLMAIGAGLAVGLSAHRHRLRAGPDRRGGDGADRREARADRSRDPAWWRSRRRS